MEDGHARKDISLTKEREFLSKLSEDISLIFERPFYTQQCELVLPVLWSAEQSGAYLQRVADHHGNSNQSGCFWSVVCGRSLNSVPSLTHEHWTRRVCIYLYFLFTTICLFWQLFLVTLPVSVACIVSACINFPLTVMWISHCKRNCENENKNVALNSEIFISTTS